jgi:hypothetical protein
MDTLKSEVWDFYQDQSLWYWRCDITFSQSHIGVASERGYPRLIDCLLDAKLHGYVLPDRQAKLT